MRKIWVINAVHISTDNIGGYIDSQTAIALRESDREWMRINGKVSKRVKKNNINVEMGLVSSQQMGY